MKTQHATNSNIVVPINNSIINKNTLTRMKKNAMIYLMITPGILFFVIFSYIPMPGIVVAFENYVPWYGIFKSEWVGWAHFEAFFSSPYFPELTRNTIILAVYKIIAVQLSAVTFAILVNEVTSKLYKKLIQSISILPYFISWIIVGAIFYIFMGNDYAVFNNVLKTFGFSEINWYAEPRIWRGLIVLSSIWKDAGYAAIIYLAAIISIDSEQYEAAGIDGASRLQKIWHITIPGIMPTMTVLVILATGHIMQGDFGQVFALVGNNAVLYPKVDVLDTFIYRNAFQMGDFSLPSAVGLFQSVVGLICVLISNIVSKKFGGQGIW